MFVGLRLNLADIFVHLPHLSFMCIGPLVEAQVMVHTLVWSCMLDLLHMQLYERALLWRPPARYIFLYEAALIFMFCAGWHSAYLGHWLWYLHWYMVL